jgi:hypothetical protein
MELLQRDHPLAPAERRPRGPKQSLLRLTAARPSAVYKEIGSGARMWAPSSNVVFARNRNVAAWPAHGSQVWQWRQGRRRRSHGQARGGSAEGGAGCYGIE